MDRTAGPTTNPSSESSSTPCAAAWKSARFLAEAALVLLPLAALTACQPREDELSPAQPAAARSQSAIAACKTAVTLFLNFDGETLKGTQASDDATVNASALIGSYRGLVTINYPPFSGTEDQKSQIAGLVADWYRPFNVKVVTTRPMTDVYSMVMVGGRGSDVGVSSASGGVAVLDCGNRTGRDIAFAFAETLQNSINWVAAAVSQESAHGFGLAHVQDETDVMLPALNGLANGFHNAQMKIPDSQDCPGSTGTQNDVALLNANVGAACGLVDPNAAGAGNAQVGALGESCAANGDCASQLCMPDSRRSTESLVCTVTCPAEGCAAGFQCSGGYCMQEAAMTAQGCSVGPALGHSAPGRAGLFALALGLVLGALGHRLRKRLHSHSKGRRIPCLLGIN